MTERPFPTDLAAANREIEDLRADRKALAYQVDKTISELDSAEKEIERLRERCEGYKGQVLTGSIEIERLRAQNEKLFLENGEIANTLGVDNLRLLALNTELLAVLERVVDEVGLEISLAREVIIEARAAIAKAKGEA